MTLLAPTPPRLPRVALQARERDAAYTAGRDVLRIAAIREHRWPDYVAGAGTLRLGSQRPGAGPSDPARLAVLDRLRTDGMDATRAITSRLIAGDIGRDAWQRAMRDVLVPRHYAAALAATGTTTLDDRTRREVEARIREQLGYLSRFRVDLGTGGTAYDGRALARADLYGGAVWATGQAARRDQAKRQGYRYEIAIQNSQDSCESCEGRAAQGLVPIGTLLAIGEGICRTRCACYLSYEMAA